MADLIVSLVEVTVWLLDETVFAMVCVMDGLFAVVTYLPSVLINLYFLLELIILGIFYSIRLILAALWLSVSFLFQMPFNLGNLFNSVLSATRDCLFWSIQVFSDVASRLHLLGFQIFSLSKQSLSYIIDCFRRYSYVVTFKSPNALLDCLFYVTNKTTALFVSLTNSLQLLIKWPFRMFLSSCEAIAASVFSICFELLDFSWNLLQACFAKFSSLLQFSTNFDSTKFNQETDSMYRQQPSYGASWLARFSQLMLAFALIIFITAFLVILYHMRSKVQAAVGNLLKLVVRKITRLLLTVRRGIDRHDRDRAHHQLLPQEVRRRELDGDAGIEEDEGEDEFAQLPLDNPRGGSAEREIGSNEAGTSKGGTYRTVNYQQLLQNERDKQLCVVCQDNEKNILIFPCKHLCACNDCVEQITNSVLLDSRRCPLCRTKISSYLDVYT